MNIAELKQILSVNKTFPTRLPPNGDPFGAKSVEKVVNKILICLIPEEDSETNFSVSYYTHKYFCMTKLDIFLSILFL